MIFWIIGSNDLAGPIPSELGLLTELTELGLRKSFLSFYLFSLCYEYIHSLAWMIFWIIAANDLTGLIPSELVGLLTELTELGLGKSFPVILLV
jgi:hypothetical protein